MEFITWVTHPSVERDILVDPKERATWSPSSGRTCAIRT